MILPIHNPLNWWRRSGDEGEAISLPPDTATTSGAAVESATEPGGRRPVPDTLVYPTATLGQVFDHAAACFGDADALIYGPSTWTYRQLAAQVDRMAAGMAAMGVCRGDTVMLTLPNCPEFVIAFMALQKLGAIVVNAGPLMGVDDLRRMFDMTQPRLVVALDLQAPNLDTVNGGRNHTCWLWVSLQAYQPMLQRLGYRYRSWQARQHLADQRCQATWSQLLEHSPPRPPSAAPDPNDVAVLQPTGGTTGGPKVAQLSHRNLLANALQLSVWASLRQGQERVVAILPMFHVYGLLMGVVCPVLNAAAILPLTRFRVHQLLETIVRHQPTVVPLVPAIIEKVCDELERSPSDDVCRALRRATVMSGAAPLAPQSARRFAGITGVAIIEGYGLTEASPVTHANPLTAPRYGSIGLPLPDTLARLVDAQDPSRDAPPGEPGELLISGPQVFGGYFMNESETAAALSIDAQGRRWLHTGDVARVDDDGYYYVIDRKKDMINHAGLKVWPAKVEGVLRQHAGVRDVAVIGQADAVQCQTVVALVVLKSSGDDVQQVTAELRTLCREHLAPYEIPARFQFVDELPRSALGKLLKYRLRGAAAAPPPNQATAGEADETEEAQQAKEQS